MLTAGFLLLFSYLKVDIVVMPYRPIQIFIENNYNAELGTNLDLGDATLLLIDWLTSAVC